MLRTRQHAARTEQKCSAADNCEGFIDDNVLGIARSGDSHEQHAAYNFFIKKYALKLQTISTSDGLIVYAFGSLGCFRQD